MPPVPSSGPASSVLRQARLLCLPLFAATLLFHDSRFALSLSLFFLCSPIFPGPVVPVVHTGKPFEVFDSRLLSALFHYFHSLSATLSTLGVLPTVPVPPSSLRRPSESASTIEILSTDRQRNYVFIFKFAGYYQLLAIVRIIVLYNISYGRGKIGRYKRVPRI